MSATVGQKIKFAEEKRPYTVQAADERYAVCTKPYMGTVLYTIVDFFEDTRSTEDLIFCMGFETKQDCESALQRLQSGESALSRRHEIALVICTASDCKCPGDSA